MKCSDAYGRLRYASKYRFAETLVFSGDASLILGALLLLIASLYLVIDDYHVASSPIRAVAINSAPNVDSLHVEIGVKFFD